MEDREYNSEEWNPIWTRRRGYTPTGSLVTGAQPVNPQLVHGQDLVDRQGVELSVPLVVGLAGGLAILTFQLLLPLLAPLLSSGSRLQLIPSLPPLPLPDFPAVALTREERPRLQNHPKCGITRGGQVSVTHIYLRSQEHNSRRNVGGIVRSLSTQQFRSVKSLQTLSVSTIVPPSQDA